jgi:hypothetical protein
MRCAEARPATGTAIASKPRANAEAAEVCFRMATTGTVPAATFFWLKTPAGWREVNRQEQTGSDGGPIQVKRVEDTRPSIDDLIRGALDRVAYSEHDASGYKTALGTGADVSTNGRGSAPGACHGRFWRAAAGHHDPARHRSSIGSSNTRRKWPRRRLKRQPNRSRGACFGGVQHRSTTVGR